MCSWFCGGRLVLVPVNSFSSINGAGAVVRLGIVFVLMEVFVVMFVVMLLLE